MREKIKAVVKLVEEEKFEEAFSLGYETGVVVSEDWTDDEYLIWVEDELFRFNLNEIA